MDHPSTIAVHYFEPSRTLIHYLLSTGYHPSLACRDHLICRSSFDDFFAAFSIMMYEQEQSTYPVSSFTFLKEAGDLLASYLSDVRLFPKKRLRPSQVQELDVDSAHTLVNRLRISLRELVVSHKQRQYHESLTLNGKLPEVEETLDLVIIDEVRSLNEERKRVYLELNELHYFFKDLRGKRELISARTQERLFGLMRDFQKVAPDEVISLPIGA